MAKDNLKESLLKLHEELSNSKKVDDESKEMLQKIVNDIHSLLDNPKEVLAEEKPNILNSLSESAQEFEVSHPDLANAINVVINGLSNFGL